MALDEGEKAALTLGVTLGCSLILIDERKGAAAARIKGLEFTGTLGILIQRHNGNGLIWPRPLHDFVRQTFIVRKTSCEVCSRGIKNNERLGDGRTPFYWIHSCLAVFGFLESASKAVSALLVYEVVARSEAVVKAGRRPLARALA